MFLYCNDYYFKISFLFLSYWGKDLQENYCRNFRGEEGGFWCFISNLEVCYEVCDIFQCLEGK